MFWCSDCDIPGYDNYMCKFMQEQANPMNMVCSSNHEGGGCVKLVGAKKRSADGKELNILVVSVVVNAMKVNQKSKVKDTSDSENYNELEHFSSEHFKILADSKTE